MHIMNTYIIISNIYRPERLWLALVILYKFDWTDYFINCWV